MRYSEQHKIPKHDQVALIVYCVIHLHYSKPVVFVLLVCCV